MTGAAEGRSEGRGGIILATLFQAIEHGDVGQVSKLIQDGVDPNEVDASTGMTALALAAEAGSDEIVTLLLDAGADPERGGLTTPDETGAVADLAPRAEAPPEPEAGGEPVHFPWMETATESPEPPFTETVTSDSEAAASEPEEGSWDELEEAAAEDDEPLVLSPERAQAFTELREQIAAGSTEGVRRLFDDGLLELDDRDESGRTPLMLAAERGEPVPVRWLLEAGADPNLADRTSSGCCALVYAVRSPSPRRTETIALLAGAGADLDQPCGRHGRTPLMHAAEADVYSETAPAQGFGLATKALIRLGARLEIKDRHGLTVWHQTKRNALGARTSSAYRRRLHQMLRVLEHAGARPVASHLV